MGIAAKYWAWLGILPMTWALLSARLIDTFLEGQFETGV